MGVATLSVSHAGPDPSLYLMRNDFPGTVAMNDGEIGADANEKLARPDFRAASCLWRRPAEVNPEAHTFFLYAYPREVDRQRPESRPQEWQGVSRSGRQDNPAVSFPAHRAPEAECAGHERTREARRSDARSPAPREYADGGLAC